MTAIAFECPHCGGTTEVDSGARDLLLEEGCVWCGEPITGSAFRPRARSP